MVARVACVKGIRLGLHAVRLSDWGEAEGIRYSFQDSKRQTDLHYERLRCCGCW